MGRGGEEQREVGGSLDAEEEERPDRRDSSADDSNVRYGKTDREPPTPGEHVGAAATAPRAGNHVRSIRGAARVLSAPGDGRALPPGRVPKGFPVPLEERSSEELAERIISVVPSDECALCANHPPSISDEITTTVVYVLPFLACNKPPAIQHNIPHERILYYAT